MQQKIAACRDRVLKKLFSLEAMSGSEQTNENIAEQEKRGLFKRDFGMEEWDWPQGIGLYGLAHSPGADPTRVREYIKVWYERQCKKGLPARNINTTVPLLTLMDYDFGEKLALDWMRWLEQEAIRTETTVGGKFVAPNLMKYDADILLETPRRCYCQQPKKF